MSAFTSSAPAPSGERRSDVSDLRQQLKDPLLDSDPDRKRVVLQRVIALMTMGVDTSSIFPEVVLACFTPDLVSKKLIYFFLTTHSERNPELAILSINTFLKECNEQSPLVRGLALRTLASLKGLPQLFDYLLPVLHKLLDDGAAYVRRIAVLCTLTVFRASPTEFMANGFYDRVLARLRDGDPQVCANALEVLLEIAEFDKRWDEERERRLSVSSTDGSGASPAAALRAKRLSRRATNAYEPTQHAPFLVTKPVLYHLLNHLDGLNEWQQAQVIDLIQQYTPASEDEMFDLMNVLEERLTGMHSGLTLSCCHAFVHLTQNYPTVHAQVLERVRQPLIMLLTCSPSVECGYAVLCHLKLFAKRAPAVYRDVYKSFFCRFTDPSYVKAMKLDILATIATAESSAAIIEELVATMGDRSPVVARRAVEALGAVALRLPQTSKPILAKFIESLELSIGRVRGPILAVMMDLLRRYRDTDTVKPFLDALERAYLAHPFTDDESRVALLWVLGEFGEHVRDAAYMMDSLSDKLLTESPAFRLQMLTSAVTLFFKRPPEMHALLGKIFEILVKDFSNADVLDRAMMYYRLLRDDASAAAHVICAPKDPITTFTEDQDADVVDKLFFEQFNTLSVVYGITADRYTTPWTLAVEQEEETEEDEEEDTQEKRLLSSRQASQDDTAAGERLLDASAAVAWGGPPVAQPLTLSPDVDVAPEDFQLLWMSTPSVSASPVNMRGGAVDGEALVAFLEDRCVFTLASGTQGGIYKLYLFAAPLATGAAHAGRVDALFSESPPASAARPASPFLVELTVPSAGDRAQLTVKSTDSARGADFAALLQHYLCEFSGS